MQQPLTILITGATAGFGLAIAERFAADGCALILTGRRQDRLDALAADLPARFPCTVYTLCFDVRRRQEVESALQGLPAPWQAIDLLVNNAGLAAGFDFIQDADPDDWDRMIDTNVKGLLYVTRSIVPGMVARKKGHIINIGSTAAKTVYEKGAVYNASKFALDALSQGMRIDLLKHGIKVTAVHPGAAETEFSLVRFNGDAERAKNVYKGFEPLHGEDIADVVHYVSHLPAHVCINDLVITPTAQANSNFIYRHS